MRAEEFDCDVRVGSIIDKTQNEHNKSAFGGKATKGSGHSLLDKLADAMHHHGTAPVADAMLKRIHQVLFGNRRFVDARHFVDSVLSELRRPNVVRLESHT